MTGRPTPETTADMTKALAQSAKTDARTPMPKGTDPLVNQPTRPLPEVPKALVSSWPAGPERAMARTVYRLILSAGARLEELLADDDGQAAAAHSQAGLLDQISHASHALVELRGLPGRADIGWDIVIPARWSSDPVELEGRAQSWDLPSGVTMREEAQAWADLLGTTVTEGLTHELVVKGHHLGVPVDMSLYMSDSETASASAVGGA